MTNLYLKILTITASLIIISGIFFNQQVSSNGGGAPAGYCSDPSNGTKTCATTCHTGGQVIDVPGLISSTIPPQGYTPGNTYTITAAAMMMGHSEFGFEISPQNSTGTLLGTLTATNTAETKIVGTGKYITHTSAGTNGNGSKTWSFDWTAPADGSGSVTFYGAFIATNNDGAKTGDTTFTSSLTFNPVGIFEIPEKSAIVSVFPIPVSDKLCIKYSVSGNETVEITLYDILGNKADVFLNMLMTPGVYDNSFYINGKFSPGVYFLKLKQNNTEHVSKVLITQ